MLERGRYSIVCTSKSHARACMCVCGGGISCIWNLKHQTPTKRHVRFSWNNCWVSPPCNTFFFFCGNKTVTKNWKSRSGQVWRKTCIKKKKKYENWIQMHFSIIFFITPVGEYLNMIMNLHEFEIYGTKNFVIYKIYIILRKKKSTESPNITFFIVHNCQKQFKRTPSRRNNFCFQIFFLLPCKTKIC